jgi:hypothetical protein
MMSESLIYLAFVSNIIEERDKVIAKKIKKLKYRTNGLSFGNLPENQFHYNKAINDVLVLLGQDEEEN